MRLTSLPWSKDQAVDSLKAILEKSKVSLVVATLSPNETETGQSVAEALQRWLAGGIRLLLWVFLITAFVALLALGNYDWKRSISGWTRH